MPVTFAYCSAAEVRAQMNMTDATQDANILLIINAASKAINDYTHRPDGFVALAAAAARIYTGSGGPVQKINECVDITMVAVKDSPTDTTYTDWAPTDWIPFTGDSRFPEFQPLDRGRPYTAIMIEPGGDYSHFASGSYTGRGGFRPSHSAHRGVPTVQVTARWGFAAIVPEPIKQATIIQVARWFKRGGSAWADALASGDLGTILYTKAVDPAIALLLNQGRFKRPALG